LVFASTDELFLRNNINTVKQIKQKQEKEDRTVRHSAGFKYVEALGRIIIGGPYPPSNAIIYTQ